MQAELADDEVEDERRDQGPQASARPFGDDPVAEHARGHRTPVHVGDGELADEAPVDLDAEDQTGPLAMIAVGTAHVLRERRDVFERVRGQGGLPGAQPVPIGATHGVERAVLLAANGAHNELARARIRLGAAAQEAAANGVGHAQREHLNVAPPHAPGTTEEAFHSRTRHCRRSPARTVVTSSGTTARALESASAESSNEAGVPMTAAL